MIFNEIYSVYYGTVAKILRATVSGGVTEREITDIIAQNAFSESVLTILPALKNEKWQLVGKDFSTPIKHAPSMPLGTLEKSWLAAIMLDPRIKLFGVNAELGDVEPLFTSDDFRVFDKYSDGDPFGDEGYIARFRLILAAIDEGRPVVAEMINRRGKEVKVRFFPRYLEYSEKDDKFRVIADGCKFSQFNLGRFTSCEYYEGDGKWTENPPPPETREVTLLVRDEKNALERVMTHFAHFEKSAKRTGGGHYEVKVRYSADDETEIVIRVLSFGPYVRAVEPKPVVDLIKERLILQKSRGL